MPVVAMSLTYCIETNGLNLAGSFPGNARDRKFVGLVVSVGLVRTV